MYKDLKSMSLVKTAFLSSLLMAGVAAAEPEAAESASVEARQLSLLEQLTNYEANALGFAINGYARAGYLYSNIDADNLAKDSPLSDASAYTRMGMTFSVRPSAESMARFDMRFHKDWQNAHREGNNSPITTWWSYDGKSLNDHLKFNLGHMRVGYSPLTVYQPMPDFIFEPTIMAEHRKEVMEDKNLDGSNDRLMQGVNLEFHSQQLGFMDDLMLHGTMARLRNQGKKKDQVFFDFDDADRYLFAGAFGVDIKGITLGVTDAYSMDHVRSSRAISMLSNSDTLYYERNNVLSFDLGFDSKRMMPDGFHFGVNAEYAMSNWTIIRDQMIQDTVYVTQVVYDTTVMADGTINYDQGYITAVKKTEDVAYMEHLAKLNNKSALLVNAYGDGSFGAIDLKFNANGLMVDKEYEAELAMTPASLGNIPVLNSDAQFRSSSIDGLLAAVRSGSLENLYFTMYESVPLNSANMMVKDPSKYESEFYRLYNNFKYAQYYRNGYNNVTLKRSELMQTSLVLDPSGNIALPYGYATPNRKGGDIDLNGKWADAVALRVVFGYYMADELDENDTLAFGGSGTKFMRVGGGANVDVARLVNMAKEWGIEVGGSFETSKETDGLERTSSRTMVGLDVTYDRISLLAGLQMLNLEFGNRYLGILDGTSEMLALGGLRFKLAAGAFATVEYGYMTNTVDYHELDGASKSMEINKNVIMADVTVNF